MFFVALFKHERTVKERAIMLTAGEQEWKLRSRYVGGRAFSVPSQAASVKYLKMYFADEDVTNDHCDTCFSP